MNTLNEYIEQCQTGDPDADVTAVFDAIALPVKWRDLFYQVVRDQCRRHSRHHVRDLETGQSGDDAQTLSAGSGSRAAFLREHFYNGDRHVMWGTATVADHEGRIAFQSALRSGINDDIELHRQAIVDIEAHGVDCLDDIGPVAS